ncbi:hypothetical protein, partial [Corynebacterium sp. HMSC08D02]|uniref:hypothetical protein n=1 Tax=Corynebacterium sp. HMSC08D02 TaxID=1581138 RepID=UPI001FEDC3BD
MILSFRYLCAGASAALRCQWCVLPGAETLLQFPALLPQPPLALHPPALLQASAYSCVPARASMLVHLRGLVAGLAARSKWEALPSRQTLLPAALRCQWCVLP